MNHLVLAYLIRLTKTKLFWQNNILPLFENPFLDFLSLLILNVAFMTIATVGVIND